LAHCDPTSPAETIANHPPAGFVLFAQLVRSAQQQSGSPHSIKTPSNLQPQSAQRISTLGA